MAKKIYHWGRHEWWLNNREKKGIERKIGKWMKQKLKKVVVTIQYQWVYTGMMIEKTKSFLKKENKKKKWNENN